MLFNEILPVRSWRVAAFVPVLLLLLSGVVTPGPVAAQALPAPWFENSRVQDALGETKKSFDQWKKEKRNPAKFGEATLKKVRKFPEKIKELVDDAPRMLRKPLRRYLLAKYLRESRSYLSFAEWKKLYELYRFQYPNDRSIWWQVLDQHYEAWLEYLKKNGAGSSKLDGIEDKRIGQGVPISDAVEEGLVAFNLAGDGTTTSRAMAYVTNQTEQPLTVTFPAGQFFIPLSLEKQVVLNTVEKQLTVAPGEQATLALETICASGKNIAPWSGLDEGVQYVPAEYPDKQLGQTLRRLVVASETLDREGAYEGAPTTKANTRQTLLQLAAWKVIGEQTPEHDDDVNEESVRDDLISKAGISFDSLADKQKKEVNFSVKDLMSRVDLTVKRASRIGDGLLVGQAASDSPAVLLNSPPVGAVLKNDATGAPKKASKTGTKKKAARGLPETWEPFKEKGLYGYKGKNGEVVVKPKYEQAGRFHGGFAAVKRKGKWVYIDSTGKEPFAVEYDSAGSFKEGVAVVYVAGKEQLINYDGKVLATWDKIGRLSDGLVPVMKRKKRGSEIVEVWGYIDKQGRLVVPPLYKKAEALKDGVGRVETDLGWGLIDKTGREIVSPRFERVTGFYEGVAMVIKKGKYGFIVRTNTGDRYIVKPVYDYAEPFSFGLGLIKSGDKFGYVDKNGKVVIEPQYDKAERFRRGTDGGGVATVSRDGKEVDIGTNGETIGRRG